MHSSRQACSSTQALESVVLWELSGLAAHAMPIRLILMASIAAKWECCILPFVYMMKFRQAWSRQDCQGAGYVGMVCSCISSCAALLAFCWKCHPGECQLSWPDGKPFAESWAQAVFCSSHSRSCQTIALSPSALFGVRLLLLMFGLRCSASYLPEA